MDTLTLGDLELVELTGYLRPSDQVRFLHQRGFYRAALHRGRVLLERAHYDAVTRGPAAQAPRPKVKPPRVKAPA